MLRKVSGLMVLAVLLFTVSAASAQTFTNVSTFTYQGYVERANTPLTGSCNFTFALFDAVTGGNQIGTTQNASSVAVTNGVFNVTLNFGAETFAEGDRFLEIGVQCAGDGSATTLSPRQPVTPAPVAMSLPGLYTTQGTRDSFVIPNVIGGHPDNVVGNGVVGVVIAGGGAQASQSGSRGNIVYDNWGTIGGGYANTVGVNNNDSDSELAATIGGGQLNVAGAPNATVGGGVSNKATGQDSTVSGGENNEATGRRSTVAGGFTNKATGEDSTVGGGRGNEATAVGATVPGGTVNKATGTNSFAAGNSAIADDAGAFIWGDNTGTNMSSPGVNTFSVRATGGIWLGTDSAPVIDTDTFITTSTGANLTTAGVWQNNSDRDRKTDIEAIDPVDVLETVAELPISSWRYDVEGEDVRHVGPMAQDFYGAFGLGTDDTTIGTVDADGVSLAAIQGLYIQNQELEGRVAKLERQLQLREGGIGVMAVVMAMFAGYWFARKKEQVNE